MQIAMDKKYTYRNGEPARILCVDRPDADTPVISMRENGAVFFHRLYGKECKNISEWDLIEVWTPQDKEPIWAWDYTDTVSRRLSFYDNINKCMFKYDGTRNGLPYTNYAKVEHVEQWMLDAQTKLQN